MVVALTVTAAVGNQATIATAQTSRVSDPELRLALDAWASFPVKARVRPLVMTSEAVSGPQSGFATDAATIAFVTGRFTAPSALPGGPKHSKGHPVVDAAAALELMRGAANVVSGLAQPPPPLVITGARFASASFSTDRGARVLPAWQFSFEGVQDPASVLAVARSAAFPAPPGALGQASFGVHLAADGRTATVSFTGAAAGTGPCTADYEVDQLASKSAVAMRVRVVRTTSPPVGYCTLVGYPRQELIRLSAPLGNRVLVDAHTQDAVTVER